MSSTLNVQKIGQDVLYQLEEFNKKIWDAISFRMIHALMSQEPELKESYYNTQEYRKQRWQKALLEAHENKTKTYELLASEDFY